MPSGDFITGTDGASEYNIRRPSDGSGAVTNRPAERIAVRCFSVASNRRPVAPRRVEAAFGLPTASDLRIVRRADSARTEKISSGFHCVVAGAVTGG